MASLNDLDFIAALSVHFQGERGIASNYFDALKFKINTTPEVASEMTEVFNMISVAHTAGYSFIDLMDLIDSAMVLRAIGEKEVVAAVNEWLSYCGVGVKPPNAEIKNYSLEVEDSTTSWDEYFFNVAKHAARNSKCLSRRIGAVIVKDKSIICTGYNGPPRGVPVCDKRWGKDVSLDGYTVDDLSKTVGVCPRRVIGLKSGEGLDICPASHAEAGSIVNAARMGINVKDATMYVTCGIPCHNCLTTIINAGIAEVVVVNLQYYDELSKFLLANSDVNIRLYDFIKE